MKKMIVFHGLARSGKDTGAELLDNHLSNLGHNVTRMAFADPIKDIGCIMFNMTRQEIEDKKEVVDDWVGKSPRWFLQEFGTEFVRNEIDSNFWAKNLEQKFNKSDADFVIVTDCRFPNEIDMAKRIGAITIKVVRDNKDSVASGAEKHISEMGLDDELFDFVIDNNGTIKEYMLKLVEAIEHK